MATAHVSLAQLLSLCEYGEMTIKAGYSYIPYRGFVENLVKIDKRALKV